jgi:hypothetical protein
LCAPQTALPERSFAGSVPFIPAVGRLDFLSVEQRMIRVFHEVLQERIPEQGPYVI